MLNQSTDIDPEPPVHLSFEEESAVKVAFELQFEKQCEPIFKFLDKAEPKVFLTDEVRRSELYDWRKKQTTSEERLIEVKVKYAEMMKKIADMKLSEKQRQQADDLKLSFKAYQSKAQ